ncbi:unnamed protein product [Medioppia subpectinata]|uniref:C2H2-type domain-containing protein n=1 Tax=Medioppia subpectinata TaxID=1979941 RepID=A0A7R9Q548_9ACAR|nr:unnamed protein product [Medioppia subpectinata]CAG2112383.1 unnamed protein product [Medioppia subpectinata]
MSCGQCLCEGYLSSNAKRVFTYLLFESYRNCLIGFADNCLCDHNFDNQLVFNHLEDEYKILRAEDCRLNDTTDDHMMSTVAFNKSQSVSNSTIDKTIEFISDQNGGDSQPMVADDNDLNYKISLSQHMKAIHFKTTDNWDNLPQVLQSDDEIIIASEDCIQSDNTSAMKSRPIVRPLHRPIPRPEYTCDWIGCELVFSTNFELRRHQSYVHKSREQTAHTSSTVRRVERFMGFKPLTIHTLDHSLTKASAKEEDETEKEFKCDLCDKSYSRKNGLLYHQNVDHNCGDRSVRMFYCDDCEYRTQNSCHMKRHVIRKHTIDKPYKCQLESCRYVVRQFATLEQFKSHQMKIHSVTDPDYVPFD